MLHGIGDGGQQVHQDAVGEKVGNLPDSGLGAVYDAKELLYHLSGLRKLAALEEGGEPAHGIVRVGQGVARFQQGGGFREGHHRHAVPEPGGLDGLLVEGGDVQGGGGAGADGGKVSAFLVQVG